MTTPKSDAGTRDIAIPRHLLPVIEKHLADHVAKGQNALLFPSVGDPERHLSPSAMRRIFGKAKVKATRDNLRVHDLRHSGAVLAAATGSSLAELMARLGHSTPQAALRYQHAATWAGGTCDQTVYTGAPLGTHCSAPSEAKS